jgi:hypothetical protein
MCGAVAGFTSGTPAFLGPIGESGNKRRTVIAIGSGFSGHDCATGRSGLARIDNEDVLSLIAAQTQLFLSGQN